MHIGLLSHVNIGNLYFYWLVYHGHGFMVNKNIYECYIAAYFL